MGLRFGLIVNPVAGLGGRVGLKGSDGEALQERARQLGAQPEAHVRAGQVLRELAPHAARFELLTYPSEMGERPARDAGLIPTVIGAIRDGHTTGRDTQRAAAELRDSGVDLLLFAGGDGTARDVCDAVGTTVPCLGIPAGVKIHSAVYAISTRRCAEAAMRVLDGRVRSYREAEVMDIDEDAVRAGRVSAALYGYLKVPNESGLVQSLKSGGQTGEEAALASIARAVVEQMTDDRLYIVGPGTTPRAVMTALGLPKTLLGVDVVRNRELVASDVSERQLLDLLGREGAPGAQIVVTVIGGQGYVFGRGNQQLSPAVIRAVGTDHITVIAARTKLAALEGRPLLVDTGDQQLDRELAGYARVIIAKGESMMVKLAP
ncbi:MAG: hypothetical protein QOH61_2333 [Chloroflexota bacterium]|nr:hypothetical protein [Chloroflexota bacterium]